MQEDWPLGESGASLLCCVIVMGQASSRRHLLPTAEVRARHAFTSLSQSFGLLALCRTIQFALTLFNRRGTSLYDSTRAFMPLPSESQLRNYRRYTNDGVGWHEAALKVCKETVDAAKADCMGGLAFDEMKLERGLCFNLNTNTLVGFVTLDPASELEHLCGLTTVETADPDDPDSSTVHPEVATHMLQFYWTSLGDPIARWVSCRD